MPFMSELAAQPLPRRGRLWVIALLAAAIFGLGYALVGIATQKAGKPVAKIVGTAEAQEIFGGVEQAGDQLGSTSAPVTIQIFNDLQCSSCRAAFLNAIPGLVERFVRPGQAKLLYRHYSASESPTEVGFYGAESAAHQGEGWQYTYLFFRNQAEAKPQVNQSFLKAIASAVEELNVGEWERYLKAHGGSGGSIARKLAEDERLGFNLGIRTGEAAIVTGPGGSRTLQEGPSLRQVEAAIKAVR
jgi:protein-disulfide isomerase